MRTLRDYLFEGFFDTSEDALPIYNWFIDAVKTHKISLLGYNGKYPKRIYFNELDTIISTDGKTIFFNKNKFNNINVLVNGPIPDYINFDKQNWEENNVTAVLYAINNPQEILKYPYVEEITLKSSIKKITIIPGDFVSGVYVTGDNQNIDNINVIKGNNLDTTRFSNFVINNYRKINTNTSNVRLEFLDIEKQLHDPELLSVYNDINQEFIKQTHRIFTVKAIRIMYNHANLTKYLRNNNVEKISFIDLKNKVHFFFDITNQEIGSC